jgi:hypothetical protein
MSNHHKNFIPFAEIKNETAVIIVDGQHAQGFVLSHWRGANIHPDLAADTSADIVLNAIRNNCPELNFPFVTATHFDIDGFIGVWALYFPEKAMEHEAVLRATANLGDFRHFDPNTETGKTALKLCCWLNAMEKKEFYRPYGSDDELEDCVEKFNYFLPIFLAVLENTEAYKEDWAPEYERVLNDLKKEQTVRTYPDLGLIVKETDTPLHYYALFSDTVDFDMVMSVYSENRYELEMKYSTWVDIISRPTLPRLKLSPLCEQLNAIEKSNLQWHCDKISDTGPILRLEKDNLSKADRYANPYEREIYSSSISAVQFEQLCSAYLRSAYFGIVKKQSWTWQEMRSL